MTRTKVVDPPARCRLLDAAERLMCAHGYAATTVDEICAAARLTKGSFFHYFDNKEDLGRQLLERFCERSVTEFRQALAGERDPLKRVYAHIDHAVQMAKECAGQRGCLLGAFAQELSESHPAMRSQCAKAFSAWAEGLKKDLDAAKAAQRPRAAIDTRSLAEHFIAVLEGSKILAKATEDPRIEARSLQHFKRYVQTLFETGRARATAVR